MMGKFLLTDRRGCYTLLGTQPESIFEGVFVRFGEQMIKVVEDIRVGQIPREVIHKLWCTERIYDDFKEKFFMEHNLLYWEASKEVNFDLILDVKESYDNSEWGRNYYVYNDERSGLLIIEFKKTEPDGINLFIASDLNYSRNDTWEKREYSYDKRRNPDSKERYVYNAIKATARKALFCFGPTKEDAIESFQKTDMESLMLAKRRRTIKMIADKSVCLNNVRNYNHIKNAYLCSIYTMDQLMVRGEKGELEGIYAGLPWFFQYWARDELISLGAVIKLGWLDEAKSTLKKYMNCITADGRIPNRVPHSDLASADGIGWLFFRMHEMLKHDKEFVMQYKDKLEECLINFRRSHVQEGLAYNHHNETWMDTDWGADGREGFRIEIQTLYLSMLRLVFTLTNNPRYKSLIEEVRTKVRSEFFNGRLLADGKDDWTVRPNIFLAYYTYPELLSLDEWSIVFQNSIKKIYLEWGGFATIDTENKLFCSEYTGEDNRSYHRGDSWFFVNNMAAIALLQVTRLGGIDFGSFVLQIVNASTKEIVEKGVVGAHAEVSSASGLESSGSQIQLWSCAMFIELVQSICSDDSAFLEENM